MKKGLGFLFLLFFLLIGCTQEPLNEGEEVEQPESDSNEEKFEHFFSLLSASLDPPKHTITYTTTLPNITQEVIPFTQTFYYKEGKVRVDTGTQTDYMHDWIIGNKIISCFKTAPEPEQCQEYPKTEPVRVIREGLIESIQKNRATLNITHLKDMTVDSETGICYLAQKRDTPGDFEFQACITEDGIVLYNKHSQSEGQLATEQTATLVSRIVSDQDLIPPEILR